MADKSYRFSECYIKIKNQMISISKTDLVGNKLPEGIQVMSNAIAGMSIKRIGTKQVFFIDSFLEQKGKFDYSFVLFDEADKNKKVLEQNKEVLSNLIDELFIDIPPFFPVEDSEDSEDSEESESK